MRGMQKWLAVLGMSVSILITAFAIPEKLVYAATEPTYELTEETAGIEAYEGEIWIDKLNVRTGFGANYDRVENVYLVKGDKVAVMSSGKASNGDTWYEVRWVLNGVEYHGYVHSHYVTMTENRAVPLPTPTPEATPTPEPTPTPVATPTPIATPTPVATPTTAPAEEEGGIFSIWDGIGIVILLIAIAAVIYAVVTKHRKEAAGTETSEKIDSLKNIQIRKGPQDVNGNPINVMKRKPAVNGESGEKEARPARAHETEATILAGKEHARMMNEEIMEKSRFYDPKEEKKKEDELKRLSESLKEKELLREEIDSLRPGDVVYHEYLGKGIVFDNSDVKRIEIRFGTDVRFIDKMDCVAKKLMRKV